MKKLKKKLRKLNNQGSSIVLVIVALSFIGIIIGSLLTASLYAYKQKLQQINAKNNFYYVEQAMQEIYAGVGVNTLEEMKKAYVYTIENMVYFDVDSGTYETLSDESANHLFKTTFMEYMKGSDYFGRGDTELAKTLESYITNDTIDLDNNKLSVEFVYEDNDMSKPLDKIIIRDVTLTRMEEYNNSNAGGTFTQTVSADIEIVKPEFNVNFTMKENDYPSIFDYALVGDMGIEVGKFNKDEIENPTYDINSSLNIVGNVYGAADFYNKTYNTGLSYTKVDAGAPLGLTYVKLDDDEDAVVGDVKVTGSDIWYNFVSVSSKDLTDKDEDGKYVYNYNGETEKSMNSGFYVDNAKVSIMADQLVVPGTVAIMNQSDVTIYSGKSDRTEIWADNIVLGGTSSIPVNAEGTGSTAFFNANLYVRDDTEINANYSTFNLNGSYYGFGDNTVKDPREFVSTVDTENFLITTDTTSFVRDHYNSSAIVINGQYDTLNLKNAKQLYLAGKAYIELSKDVAYTDDEETEIRSELYTYTPVYGTGENTSFIRDYQTGESLSIKYNQSMYNISGFGSAGTTHYTIGDKGIDTYSINISTKPEDVTNFFYEYFPTSVFFGLVPCTKVPMGNKTYCFIDFASAYELLKAYDAMDKFDIEGAGWTTYEAYVGAYIDGYMAAMADEDNTALRTGFTDITNDQADASIVYGEDSNIYSSGAITTKKDSSVSFVTANEQTVENLLSSSSYISDSADLLTANKNFADQYLLRKWTLNDKNKAVSTEETAYIKAVVSTFGEAAVTPINRYMLFDEIDDDASPALYEFDGGDVIISGKDVVLSADTYGADFTGIIITKGDVYIPYGVNSFKGTIIAGGKVYIDKSVKNIAAGYYECKAILDECLTTMDEPSKKVLEVFKMYYEVLNAAPGEEGDAPVLEENYYGSKPIETIDYTDVVAVQNWQKSVGGGYDHTH